MGRRPSPSTLRRRWATSDRSGTPEQAQLIADALASSQPRCWPAVVADAEATARFRGEHHRFRSDLDALVQVLRLCWVTESFFALVCYRARTALRNRRVPVLPTLLHHLSVLTGQVAIGDLVVVQPGLYLPHGQVVVDGLTRVGAGVVLRPFVTVGLRDGDPVGPTLGDRVQVGTGAKVFGPIDVGDGARIGANAVVLADVPAGATAVGVPARVLADAPADER